MLDLPRETLFGILDYVSTEAKDLLEFSLCSRNTAEEVQEFLARRIAEFEAYLTPGYIKSSNLMKTYFQTRSILQRQRDLLWGDSVKQVFYLSTLSFEHFFFLDNQDRLMFKKIDDAGKFEAVIEIPFVNFRREGIIPYKFQSCGEEFIDAKSVTYAVDWDYFRTRVMRCIMEEKQTCPVFCYKKQAELQPNIAGKEFEVTQNCSPRVSTLVWNKYISVGLDPELRVHVSAEQGSRKLLLGNENLPFSKFTLNANLTVLYLLSLSGKLHVFDLWKFSRSIENEAGLKHVKGLNSLVDIEYNGSNIKAKSVFGKEYIYDVLLEKVVEIESH
eukprot:snap_masked-scaffold_5-processed-gene-20.47-mRNA-1 protein AED:1.00 eAED:1.00 QI:0/-1/0/0/-1/1/1/0/329